jgi:hypothetical protein
VQTGRQAGVIFAIALVLLARLVIRRIYALKNAHLLARSVSAARVERAIKLATTVSFPACYIPLPKLRVHGKLLRHEVVRDAGELILRDTYDDMHAFAAQHFVRAPRAPRAPRARAPPLHA